MPAAASSDRRNHRWMARRHLAQHATEGELEPIAPDDPVVAAYLADIDRSLLRENLSKTPEQRVESLQALQRLAAEAHRAGAALRRDR